ncbi:putative transcriptional regulator [Gracilibacillus halophilus YIM-C55.5]|uniref:Putative transcriptional regulator n=1 Tax=Gracilibacillus halophilus YIM-C55.5 TaxID=1308866 RepID=N4W9S7_9BACI|nr:RNA-binding domain-containing protein [Gracilibacillus halophilus]ENH96019.1 putative transcriptional regulator [Gracilibacillus halophilus YIM-C55.5]
MNNSDFLDLIIDSGEDAELECKLAKGKVPKEMWYSYSAFANTNGGIILLGVKEEKGEFFPEDVDVVKLQKDFWDSINNPQKVSANILQNDDVVPLEVDGNSILKIVVPRAMRQQKPVYVGQNPYVGTYRRNFEGDYKCSDKEVQRMIAEQSSSSQDSQILENFDMNDINMESLKNYRKRFANLKPDSTWNEHDDIEFLTRIGGWNKDRVSKKEGLTIGGLLMFGEEKSITDYFPHYFLDYREKLSDIPGQRWSNRITSQDGTWSGNLYDFYFKVIGKITSDIDVPFQIEGDEFIRQTESRVHKALREAVLNTIIHANYFGEVGIVIEKKKSFFRFSNPGILRMPYEKAIVGGNSDPRNPLIFKMFAQIGLGERSGYGLESIHTTWKLQHWKRPALLEEFQPERTTLTLLPTSLLPKEIVSYIKEALKDRSHLLSPDELLVLVTAYQEKNVTNVRLQDLTNKHSTEINKILSNLVEEGLLLPQGFGRGTTYILSDAFVDNEENMLSVSNEENIDENINNLGSNEESPGNRGES